MKGIRKDVKTVFVGLSGGVDSSVAAALLKERGFNVVGIHIKMWAPSREQGTGNREQYDGVCRQQYQDRIDAVRVAAHLGIPFRTWDLSREYRAAVVDYLIREYASGRTPNPDVMCNREIKFGVFLRRAIREGADFVATGHYTRIVREFPISHFPFPNNDDIARSALQIENNKLKIATDPNKDQSYFLWTLTQEQLAYCIFPIGEFTKAEVRTMARKFGLPTAEKPDSQGICFIGEIDVREFLQQHIPSERGKVFTTSGKAVGEHGGAAFYTIGQRHGIGVGGGIPYYVARKDMAANTLTVVEGPYDEHLFRRELTATDAHWVSGSPPAFPLRCEARIRYRQPLRRCIVERIRNQELGIRSRFIIHNSEFVIRVVFDEPQRAVTPGQSVVFYRGEEMLGGAIIA